MRAQTAFDNAANDVRARADVDATLAQALAAVKAARSSAEGAKSGANSSAVEARLDQAITTLVREPKTRADLLQKETDAANVLSPLGLAPTLVSLIGVTLVKATSSTDPSKLKVTGAGAAVCLQDGGIGTLEFQVSGTPTTDSGAVSIDGATVASTLDSNTGVAMPAAKSPQTGHTFTKDGKFTIGLMDLTDSTTVSLSVQAYAGSKTDGNAAKSTYIVSAHCSPTKIVQR